MISRKKHSSKATALPSDFLRTVVDLFNKQFAKERGGDTFLVWGELYMSEVILCVSLTNAKSLQAGTIYCSVDLSDGVAGKPSQVTRILQQMVDVAASWVNQAFTQSKEKGLDALLEDLHEQPNTWQELTWEKKKIFVKLNRDNRTLENAANEFLRQKGIDPESKELNDLDLEDESDPGRKSNLH